MSPRAQAKALGYKTYRASRPCRFGHDTERFTANGTCVQCARRSVSLYRSRQPVVERYERPRVPVRNDLAPLAEQFAQGLHDKDPFALALLTIWAPTAAGPACKYGHQGERYASGQCKECAQLHSRLASFEAQQERRLAEHGPAAMIKRRVLTTSLPLELCGRLESLLAAACDDKDQRRAVALSLLDMWSKR